MASCVASSPHQTIPRRARERFAFHEPKGFIVRTDELLTRLWNSKQRLNRLVLLPFCKSEWNSFTGGGITAFDSGHRIAKRIHL